MNLRLPNIKGYTAFLCLCSITVITIETLQMGSSSGALFDLIFRPFFVIVLFVAIVVVNRRPEATSVSTFTLLQFCWPLLTMSHSGGWTFSEFTDVKDLCTSFDQFPLVAMFVSALCFLTLVPARVRYSWLVPAAMPVSYMLWTLPFRPECSASGYLRLSMTSGLLLIGSMLLIRGAVLREQLERQVFETARMAPQERCKDTEHQQVWILNEELSPAPASLRQVVARIGHNYTACYNSEGCESDLELSPSSDDEALETKDEYVQNPRSSSSQANNQIELDVCRYVNKLVLLGEKARMEQAHFKNTREVVESLQLAKRRSKSESVSSSSPWTRRSELMDLASSKVADYAPHLQSNHCLHKSTSEGSSLRSLIQASPQRKEPRQSANGHASNNLTISSASSSTSSGSEDQHPIVRRPDVLATEHSFDGHWKLCEEHPGMNGWVRQLMIFGMDVVDGEGKLRSMQRDANGKIRFRSGMMHIEQGKLYRLGASGVSWVYKYVGSADHSLLQQNIKHVEGSKSKKP